MHTSNKRLPKIYTNHKGHNCAYSQKCCKILRKYCITLTKYIILEEAQGTIWQAIMPKCKKLKGKGVTKHERIQKVPFWAGNYEKSD